MIEDSEKIATRMSKSKSFKNVNFHLIGHLLPYFLNALYKEQL